MKNEIPMIEEIFKYWTNKEGINPLYQEVDFLIDWGEPTCWACEEGWNGRYDTKTGKEHSIEEHIKLWENSPIEPCYIVPKELEGRNSPDNATLLCHHCCIEAPHTNDRNIFIKWMKERKTSRLLTINYYEKTGQLKKQIKKMQKEMTKYETNNNKNNKQTRNN